MGQDFWQGRVLLCGESGAGKDTVADMLQGRVSGRPVVRLAFADALKSQVHAMLSQAQAMFGWGDPASVRNLVRPADTSVKLLRGLWQAYGTDVVRRVDQTYWVRQLEERFRQVNGLTGALVIVTDGRFANEVAWCRRNNFLVVRMLRAGSRIDGAGGGHSSEHGLPSHEDDPDWYDLVCENNGSRRELEEWVDNILWDEVTRRWPGLRK